MKNTIRKPSQHVRSHETRLARECAKLDPKLERAMAEEGIVYALSEWPDALRRRFSRSLFGK
jgi:hypothetical protein